MILYIEHPRDSTRKLLELINEYSKVAEYKINRQKSLAFLYTNNEKTEREIKETIPFTIATKRIKYLRVYLPKELFIIARTWKQPRCPSADEWIRKLWYIYTMEYYSAIKRNSFESVLMRWMKLEPIIQSEVSQKVKDQYSILTHIYGKFRKMVTITLYAKQKKRHRCIEQTFGLCGRW